MNAPTDHEAPRHSRIAIACQGGGSHAAYVAGVLRRLLKRFEADDEEPLHLVAISGTSGGAICAVVAWWGLLTGGPARAIERLEMFWENNCAQKPGEVLLNAGTISALESLPYEITFNPAAMPLREMVQFCTTVWPMMAQNFDDWIRPDYFRLDASLKSQLGKPRTPEFDRVTTAICRLCSIPADVQAWCAAALEESLGGLPGGEPQGTASQTYQLVFDKLMDSATELTSAAGLLLEPAWLLRAMNEYGYSAQARVQALSQQIPATYLAGKDSMLLLDQILAPTLCLIPRLIIGAVDVGSGEFRAFRSDRCEPPDSFSIQSVLASAAIPNLFKEVKIGDGRHKAAREYWDGLFSQNPPVKTFTLPPGETPSSALYKPDEIWVAQVNPRRCHTEDGKRPSWHRTSGHFELFDRRNELSGNLSLFQEIDFINALNRRIDTGGTQKHDDQHIQVFTIPLDDPTAQRESRRMLGYPTKLDRDIGLKNALLNHGDEQGGKFLPVRDFIVEFLNQRQAGRRQAYRNAHGQHHGFVALLNDIDALHSTFRNYFRTFIEEMAIGEHPSCDCRKHHPWDVTLHWRASGAGTLNGNDYRADLRGYIHLKFANGALVDGRLDGVRIIETDCALLRARNPSRAPAHEAGSGIEQSIHEET